MRLLVQRVSEAWVDVEGTPTDKAGPGLLALVGFQQGDGEGLLEPMADKLINLRVFADDKGLMNRSLLDMQGDLVLVSQFTLYGNVRKGRRPSFIQALHPDESSPLNDAFVALCQTKVSRVITGRFGADMQVHLVNDGPVTLLLDSDELGLAGR